jgi:NADH-quinone oxidoreductase subunit E
MLEIASQILICLLAAALIGFMIGYLTCKSRTKKTALAETIEEPTIENSDEPEEVAEPEIKTDSEEIEIPTEDAIGKALEALDEIDKQEVTETLLSEKPELLTAPRNGEKDSLTEIKGIGPKVENKLNEAGIYHFDQIANWTQENIQWLEENTVFAHRAKKDLWIPQAKALL